MARVAISHLAWPFSPCVDIFILCGHLSPCMAILTLHGQFYLMWRPLGGTQVSGTAELLLWAAYEPLIPMISRWVLCLFLISKRCFQFNLFIEVLYNLHDSVALCLHQHLSLKFLWAFKPRIPYQHLCQGSHPDNSSTCYWTVALSTGGGQCLIG